MGFLDNFEAAGRVTGATGVATVARGCATARTGVGVYTITPSREIDQDECVIFVMCELIDMCVTVVHTSDAVKTVSITSTAAQAATDADFQFAIIRISGGAGR